MYFNYHAKVKRLILDNQLLYVKFYDNYNNISPAMVLYFKNDKPMPIREYRFEEYFSEFPFLKDYIKEE